ncbi:MAG: FUSC family protein [Verrucomicrobia bacterium]|nr:FUSC family protein [Verrucomicrobiota bacterium]
MGSSRTAGYSRSASSSSRSFLSSAWKTFTAWHTKIDEPQLQFSQGFRGALGITVPVFLGLWFHHPTWGGLAAVCTFWVLLCDVGGAYRQKALTQSLAVVGLLIAFPAGLFCAQIMPLEVVGTFVWLFAAGFLNVGGNAAAQASFFSAILFIVSPAYKDPNEFWVRELMCLLGGVWAMTLCLGLWIVHPFAPIFAALAESYEKLAQLAHDTWQGFDEAKGVSANLKFALDYEECVAKITHAREVWGAVRARRLGPSARSVLLITLIEDAELVAAALLGFRHYLNSIVTSGSLSGRRSQLQVITSELGEVILNLAQSIASRGEGFDSDRIEERLRTIDRQFDEMPATPGGIPSAESDLRRTLQRIIDQVSETSDSVAELSTPGGLARDRRQRVAGKSKPWRAARERFGEFFASLVDNFTFQSKAFRHALRLALATTGTQFLAIAFHLPRGYWIPVTVLVIMKPNFGGTLQRAAQRITGTIGGALIAAAITIYVHEPLFLLATFATVAFTAFTVRQLNFAFYTLWLTVMVMVLLDIGSPGDWVASFWRMLHTAVGGAIAVFAGYLVFPLWEKDTLPGELAGVLTGLSDFAKLIGSDRGPDFPRRLGNARRRTSLLLANAQTAGQRLVADPAHLRGEVTASLTVINAARQLFHGLVALVEAREWVTETERLNFGTFLDPLSIACGDLATALRQCSPIPKLPDVRSAAEDSEDERDEREAPWIRTHLFNLANQVDVITESVRRIVENQ